MTVDQEKIRQRARDIWDAAGRPEGRDVEFWLQAEAEVAGNGRNDDKVVTKKAAKAKEVKPKVTADAAGGSAKGKHKKA